MDQERIELIRQALAAAESSINVARSLLRESEGGRDFTHQFSRREGREPDQFSRREGREPDQFSRREGREPDRGDRGKRFPAPQPDHYLPGVIGVFDGESMVVDNGKKYPIPPNYISKSMLVEGDRLKMITENGENSFKQIERVKRNRLTGVLAQKEGKYVVITSDGSFKVLPQAVEHFNAHIDTPVVILVSAKKKCIWAAIENLEKKEPEVERAQKPEAAVYKEIKEKPRKGAKKEEVKEKKSEEVKNEPKPESKPEVVQELKPIANLSAKQEVRKEAEKAAKVEEKTDKKEKSAAGSDEEALQ